MNRSDYGLEVTSTLNDNTMLFSRYKTSPVNFWLIDSSVVHGAWQNQKKN